MTGGNIKVILLFKILKSWKNHDLMTFQKDQIYSNKKVIFKSISHFPKHFFDS